MTKNENKKKIILDLCGGTGAWSKPYKDAGYFVKNITLPDFDVTEVKFEKDIEQLELINNEIKNDKQCLTDEALNLFIKSKPAIIEKDGKKYEPVFSVKYRLIK